MRIAKKHIAAIALACVGLLLLTGLAMAIFSDAPSTPSGQTSNWQKVRLIQNPNEAKRMSKFGTVSVSLRVPAGAMDSNSLYQAALASLKQQAAQAGATDIRLDTHRYPPPTTTSVLLIADEFKSINPC